MSGIVKTGGGSYEEYEELILQRDHLKKEAVFYESEYRRVFGKLSIALHEEKLKCSKLKSAISYCTACVNRGQAVDLESLKNKVKKDTEALNSTLDGLVLDYESAKPEGILTDSGMKKVKELYHELAKMLHPDINPGIAGNRDLKDLWYEVSDAYVRNDLKRLQELKVLAASALKGLGEKRVRVHVPDLGEKIGAIKVEIEEIKATEPYTLKFLLEDEKKVLEAKKKLLGRIKEFKEYRENLNGILKGILPEAGSIEWELN